MSYLFLAQGSCSNASQPLYCPVDQNCYDTCPTPLGVYQYLTTNCLACHYSCKTCDNGTELNCLSCDTSLKRDALTVSSTCTCCPCSGGYVEVGVAMC